ncbi:hypothetical protein LPC08_06700 [Roseomonas sp. OT10]|uniref:hypothetical protein n=1 Tax=Roseomonas cutis TaxID=2897332 RepID=UPI001E5BE00C|nr:hypothetical protein [Roseomonas sp. OT10]UFN50309.1 hypothetical protein LPC08_06700 [Roseomonas sp. OT10]
MPLPWRAPAFPLAVGAAVAPTIAVLQSKAMAPLAVLVLALSILAHRRAVGHWPRLRGGGAGAATLAGLALCGWAALSAAWALEPARALATAGQVAALLLLGAAAARAMAEAPPPPWLGRCVFWGVLAGLAAGMADLLTGQALRMGVRGLSEAPAGLEFGLKPAASVAALLLPLLLLAPLSRASRAAGVVAGAAALLLLPGDTAKLSGLLGVLVALGAMRLPRLARHLAAAGLAALLLLGPVLSALLIRPEVAARLPYSGVHRLLVWDFALGRAAERPWLGWGMESSRALPGGRQPPSPAAVARLEVTRPDFLDGLARPGTESLPLHPHNGPIQIRLELGRIGLVLAAGFAALLALAVPSAGLGVIAAGLLTFLLSFGTWQPWWLASQALAAALTAGLARRP